MKSILQLFINQILIVIIYLYYLVPIFQVHGSAPSLLQYLTYGLHTFLVYLILQVFLTIPINAVLRLFSKTLAGLSMALMQTVLIILAVADCKVYTSLGIHAYDRIVFRTLMNPNWERELQLGYTTMLSVAVLILLGFVLQFLLWRYLQNYVYLRVKSWKNLAGVAAVTALVYWPANWIYSKHLPDIADISNSYPFYTALLGVPGQHPLTPQYKYPKVERNKAEKQKNIVFIMAESLRGDFLSNTYMPGVMQFSEKENCINSKYHYSGGHTTEYGIFSALYGLHGYHFEPFRDNRLPSFGLHTLKQSGYELIGGSSGALSAWNNQAFMYEVFDQYKEFNSKTVHEDDQKMLEWVEGQMAQKSSDPRFFFIFFNTTHHNYFFPKEFEIHQPVMEQNYNHVQNKLGTELYRKKIYNRYKNSVLYLDHLVSSFLSRMRKELGPDTIIVFTGDHGEEFWEHGLLGHGKTNYINERVRVPLLICDSGLKNTSPTFSSHVDIFPTLFDRLGISTLDQFNGVSMLEEGYSDKGYTVITGPEFPFGRNKMGIVEREYKFWMKKSSKYLHHLYKIKTTDLDDHPVLDGRDKEALSRALESFSTDAYRFLNQKTPAD